MRTLQEKLTFWRLAVVVGVLLVVSVITWGISNIESLNYFVHNITLKMRGAAMYETGNSLKFLSRESKSALRALLNSSPNIAAIQIINVDFKRNERYSTFFASNNATFVEEFSINQSRKRKNLPLFTKEEAWNNRVVSIINNNFICTPFEDTLSATLYPIAGADINQVCSMSVPPFLGHFVGFINVHLYGELTKKEEEALRLTIATVSSSIYERDIIRK